MSRRRVRRHRQIARCFLPIWTTGESKSLGLGSNHDFLGNQGSCSYEGEEGSNEARPGVRGYSLEKRLKRMKFGAPTRYTCLLLRLPFVSETPRPSGSLRLNLLCLRLPYLFPSLRPTSESTFPSEFHSREVRAKRGSSEASPGCGGFAQ
jgi:hypothetical protein